MDNQYSGSNNKESNNNSKDTNKGSYSKSGSSKSGGSSRSSSSTSSGTNMGFSGGDDDSQIMPSNSPVRPVGSGSDRSEKSGYGGSTGSKELSSMGSGTSSTTLPTSAMSDSGMGGDWMSNVSGRAGEFENRIKEFVKQRPLAILAGALAIGFVANRIFMSREANT